MCASFYPPPIQTTLKACSGMLCRACCAEPAVLSLLCRACCAEPAVRSLLCSACCAEPAVLEPYLSPLHLLARTLLWWLLCSHHQLPWLRITLVLFMHARIHHTFAGQNQVLARHLHNPPPPPLSHPPALASLSGACLHQLQKAA